MALKLRSAARDAAQFAYAISIQRLLTERPPSHGSSMRGFVKKPNRTRGYMDSPTGATDIPPKRISLPRPSSMTVTKSDPMLVGLASETI